MIKNKILGTKINLPGTSPWMALTIAASANGNDGKYAPGDILLANDVYDLIQSQAGTPEEFKFTLEDGSVVTKFIRVVSSTTTSTSGNSND